MSPRTTGLPDTGDGLDHFLDQLLLFIDIVLQLLELLELFIHLKDTRSAHPTINCRN